LHPIDLAVNKVLALAGRDEPRDLLDTLYQHREVLCLGALCWAACGKDVSRRAFVDPRESADAVPHYGRPGGVLPRVQEDD
jgi:hypothetical protein